MLQLHQHDKLIWIEHFSDRCDTNRPLAHYTFGHIGDILESELKFMFFRSHTLWDVNFVILVQMGKLSEDSTFVF